jgi:hypothetical protein
MHASGTHIPSSPNVAAECQSPKPHALARPFVRVACQLTDLLPLRVEPGAWSRHQVKANDPERRDQESVSALGELHG